MSVTIHEVLGDLRASALDERDKGDKFERLVQSFLRTDPEWTAKFDDVWTWTEWPERGTRTDTGIDLVAKVREADTYAAIQCKFYDENAHGREGRHRLLPVRARRRPSSALATSSTPPRAGRRTPTRRSRARWSRSSGSTSATSRTPASTGPTTRGRPPRCCPPPAPRRCGRTRRSALDDVRAGSPTADRGKLIMACGTGKTFTSLQIAEDLVGEGGSVLFLVPSIQLMCQTPARVDGQPRGRHPALRGLLRRPGRPQGLRRRRPLHRRPDRARHHRRRHARRADGDRAVRHARG